MAAVLVRAKGMAGVLCDLHQWQRALCHQSNVQFSTRLVQNKKNLQTLFPSHLSCVWHNEWVIWPKKEGRNCTGLLFLCYFFAFVLFGVFGFGFGLSLSFCFFFLFLKSFSWCDLKAPYLFWFPGLLAVVCFYSSGTGAEKG